jgi:hypothetical protein
LAAREPLAAMATHAPRGGRATLAGVAVVCGVALAALGPHVFAGGFHVDDWVDASHYYFHSGEGFWAAVSNHQDVKRDVYAVLRTAIYALFGMHTAPHLALTALIATAEASLLLVLLRRLGLAAAPATMAALLLLVWPDADSTRLWATGFQMGLFAGLLPLAGLLVALRGLEQSGWRGAALHGVALTLYATGVNGYELGAPMIMLFGILYVWHRPGSAARWRWAADVIVVLGLLIRYAGRHPHLPAIGGVPDHLRIIASHGLEVMARALLPVRGIPAAAVLAPALAIVVAAAVAVSRPHLAARTRGELRQALLLLVGGLVVTVAGWGMIIPAALGYDPGSSGVGNRINAVAAIGLAVVVVAFAGLLAVAIRSCWRRAPSLALLTTLLAMPVALADLVRLQQDATDWNHAADVGRAFLVRLRELVPDPVPGSTLFTFGVSGYAAPSVPIFGGGGNNDLLGAVRVTYGTDAISGFPVLGGMQFSCGSGSMTLLDTRAPSTTPYGLALLVDMRGAGQVLVPRSESDCLRATTQLAPYAPVNEKD